MSGMTGILETFKCGECIENGERRNGIASVVAGVLFFSGWWIMIDVAALAHPDFRGAYYLCGVFGTIALFMINVISNAQLRGDAYTEGCLGPRGARIWLFVGFVMGFASLIASGWILIASNFLHKRGIGGTWPGIALLLQNVCIFMSSLIYKFGRSEDMWG